MPWGKIAALSLGVAAIGALAAVGGMAAAGGGDHKEVEAKRALSPGPSPSEVEPSASPSAKKPEPATTTKAAESESPEGVQCTEDELPVSNHGTITCASEEESCALGSPYVTLMSNCGAIEPGRLLPKGTYESFSKKDCLRLESGRFEDGTVTKVDCFPESEVSAIVVDSFPGDVAATNINTNCYADDGSHEVFLAYYYSGATNMQTLCLKVANGA